MRTVKEVSRLTGVSIRTLHHYDAIGLLKPTQVTDAGYRLYDETALERLYMILVYRELGLRLREIGNILDAPDYDRNRILEHQTRLMQEKINKLQNRITLANGMLTLGVKYMDFKGFDPQKMDDYSQQAKMLYGKTDAYQQFQKKSQGQNTPAGKGFRRAGNGFLRPAGSHASLSAGQRSCPYLGKGIAGFLYRAFLHLHTPDPSLSGGELRRWQQHD